MIKKSAVDIEVHVPTKRLTLNNQGQFQVSNSVRLERMNLTTKMKMSSQQRKIHLQKILHQHIRYLADQLTNKLEAQLKTCRNAELLTFWLVISLATQPNVWPSGQIPSLLLIILETWLIIELVVILYRWQYSMIADITLIVWHNI